MNVLVTGGAGYIGSHTCKELHRRGHKTVVVDDLGRGHKEFVKWSKLYQNNIIECDRITQILIDEKIEAVVHFAAFAYVGESVKDPIKYFQNNVSGSISLLKGMEQAKVQKIIFSSSCATYGTPDHLPISETTRQEPINPYGLTKLMVEQILRDQTSAKADFSAIALRYFNAAGADPDLEVGESHDPETHLIPLTLKAALDPHFELSVFGDDYQTPDGTCIRDYIHVLDLAKAHAVALESMSSAVNRSKGFQAYNLGTGRGFSVKDIISEVEAVTGKKVKYRMAPRREGDPAELVANANLIRSELGWVPHHSDLKTIINTAYRWATQ